MFRDVSGLPFISDGVSLDAVRAGEPRLVRFRHVEAPAPARAVAARRAPVLRRLLRTVAP